MQHRRCQARGQSKQSTRSPRKTRSPGVLYSPPPTARSSEYFLRGRRVQAPGYHFAFLRDVVCQSVDFFGQSEKTNFGRNVSISDVIYALERSWASDQDELGLSTRRRRLPSFFAS